MDQRSLSMPLSWWWLMVSVSHEKITLVNSYYFDCQHVQFLLIPNDPCNFQANQFMKLSILRLNDWQFFNPFFVVSQLRPHKNANTTSIFIIIGVSTFYHFSNFDIYHRWNIHIFHILSSLEFACFIDEISTFPTMIDVENIWIYRW